MRPLAVGLAMLLTLFARADERVETLLARMTLEEKIGQLIQYAPDHPDMQQALKTGMVGSVLNTGSAAQVNGLQRAAMAGSRLHIPLLVAHDVVHGYRTIFPIPLAIAATWDPSMAELSARSAARESRAAGIRWTFAPMVDIARDPRWGRIAEGAGEDPYLGSLMAAAYVLGFQNGPRGESLLACAKHFAGYGAAQGGRDYGEADISPRTLREVYLQPFRAAVDAGVGSLMTSFNTINGTPSSGNRQLLRDILRNEWKFRGLVVSDWASIAEMMNHGVAASREDAAALALQAGVDVDMADGIYLTLVDSVRNGKISTALIDDAVRRVLQTKSDLGLFDGPFVDESLAAKVMGSPEHRAAARRVAERSIVLLANDGALPLQSTTRIALVGGLADARDEMLGPWPGQGRADEVVTVVDAFRRRAARANVRFATTNIDGATDEQLAAAVELAKESDVIVACVGEPRAMSGEAASRAALELPGRQHEWLDALAATGKPLVVIVFSGRPLALTRVAAHASALVEAWFPGSEAGNAIVDVLFGDVNPSGRLPVTMPRTAGQVPIHYAHLPSGRPADPANAYTNKYIDLPIGPLYSFGFGLSYTTFEYANLNVSAPVLRDGGSVIVSADVRNAGRRAGEEVVQLYVRDVVASVSRPVRELKGFRRVALAPGETKRVAFTLTPADLRFWGESSWIVEPGFFDVWIAPNAQSGIKGTFEYQ